MGAVSCSHLSTKVEKDLDRAVLGWENAWELLFRLVGGPELDNYGDDDDDNDNDDDDDNSDDDDDDNSDDDDDDDDDNYINDSDDDTAIA